MVKKNEKPTPEQIEAREERIDNLLQQLAKFGKGERASQGARKIRRQLRKLGHYISKVKAEENSNTEMDAAEATA